MKKALLLVSVVVVLLIAFSCTTSINKPSGNSNREPANSKGSIIVFGELKDGEYTEGKILVGYYPGSRNEVNKIVSALNGKVVVDLQKINMVSISFNGTVKEAYKKIKELKLNGIRYVEPSYKRYLIEPTRVERDPEILGKGRVSLASTRNWGEEMNHELWGLEAMGITTAHWEEASGTGIIVAVVDTGVDGGHPDLAGQVVKGYRPKTDEELAEGTNSAYGGAHGTHVAGTIAAKKDGKGIVGVAPGAKIMPIVIFDESGYVGDDEVAEGIIWAVDNGAKVMNHSWGGWGYSHTLKDAFDYALQHNVAMVASAGNSHYYSHHRYPAGYPGVIQVGAVMYNGGDYKTVWFSNRSDGVIVGAPGVHVLSTVPGFGRLGYGGHNSNVPVTNGGAYDYYQGTSMAAPHVAGAVAVLMQKFPGAQVWQIRKLIEQTAQDIDKQGWDYDSGYGLVRLDRALAANALPTSGGVERYRVKVTDAYGSWGVPTVFVQLKRSNGSCYYAKTDSDGNADFYHVDADDYNLFVGGPDSWDRVLVPGSTIPGYWAIAWRMEEERQHSETVSISVSDTKRIRLSSEFKVEFDSNLQNFEGQVIIFDLITEKNVYSGAYSEGQTYDLSELSGLLQIIVVSNSPVDTDTTITGTVTLNGATIKISGIIPQGEDMTHVNDFDGAQGHWWTVFGFVD